MPRVVGESKRFINAWTNQEILLLAMSNFSSHASFFATDFSAAFTGFLSTHLVIPLIDVASVVVTNHVYWFARLRAAV